MKLEIKDLAPYLPYGLKMYHKGVADTIKKNNQKYNPTTLKALTTEGLFWVGKESNSRKLDEDIHKPILRPLSDLTEEQYAELDLNHNFSIVRFSDLEKDPTRYPYTIVQKLIEWHFDVFGLIEKGLAIDINTLEQ